MASSFAFAFAFASIQPVAEPAVALAPATEQIADAPLESGTGAPPEPAATAAEPTTADEQEFAALKGFSDPIEPVNRVFFAISQPIDRLIIRPLAMTYKAVVPKPVRDGARNAMSHLREPIVFANDLLQLRPGRAIRTLSRFLINTIFGFGGLFDAAKRKPFNLAHRNNNFGDTLGYYGVGPILYVYLPVLGPTTARDYPSGFFVDGRMGAEVLDKVMHPASGRKLLTGETKTGPVDTVITVVDGLDQRVENDFDLKTILEDSIDPYAALRSSYLQDRAAEIAQLRAKDGQPVAVDAFDDALIDPEAAPASNDSKPAAPPPQSVTP